LCPLYPLLAVRAVFRYATVFGSMGASLRLAPFPGPGLLASLSGPPATVAPLFLSRRTRLAFRLLLLSVHAARSILQGSSAGEVQFRRTKETSRAPICRKLVFLLAGLVSRRSVLRDVVNARSCFDSSSRRVLLRRRYRCADNRDLFIRADLSDLS